MEENIIEEDEEYKSIGLHAFDYKLSEEEEGGCMRKGIYGYPYLKHPIEL